MIYTPGDTYALMVCAFLFHGRPGAPIPRGIIYAGPSRREHLERSLSIAVARRLGFNRE